MVSLEKLENWPSPKNTRIMLITGIILVIIILPIMSYFFTISKFPVSFVESQLSFSGEVLKQHYAVMLAGNGLAAYRTAQILDYVYMLSYGTIYFCLALMIARRFDTTSRWRQSGHYIAIAGILAACFDAIENVFILATLTDPLDFPNSWAIAHSCFALAKFIDMFIVIGWLIVAFVQCTRCSA